MYIVSSEKTPKVTMILDVQTDSIADVEVWFVGDSVAAACSAVVTSYFVRWEAVGG
jgi:hypothetical protein